MKTALALLLLLALPSVAIAKKADPGAACPEPVKPQLFFSPMGEPFRPGPAGGDDPVRVWFDQADRNHDGQLTIGEMMLDADRFFATLDTDLNGELLPDEVAAYEEKIAPEIRLYQPRRMPDSNADAQRDRREERQQIDKMRKQRRLGLSGYDGAIGAGRFSVLNIPNPVASADDDINRAVSKAEFRAAAAERFRDLDPGQKKLLTFADLPKTPAQTMANAACLARAKDARKAPR